MKGFASLLGVGWASFRELAIDQINDLLQRLARYSPYEVAAELLVIGLVVWLVLRFVQGTRAAGALKGVLVILVLTTLVARLLGGSSFGRVGYLYDKALALVAVAMIVIFQPELRRGLVRLGETSIFGSVRRGHSLVVDELVPACVYLAKAKFGAIVVIERQHGLKGLVEGGTEVDARLNRRLLQTIFFPGSALHDLAVVIRGEKIAAAGVQLPMADPGDMPDASLGARHRAAVGLTRESDALVVVVSEETGAIRVAERGRLSSPMTGGELTEALASRLRARSEREGSGEEDRAQAALQAELADTEGVTKSEASSRGGGSEREGVASGSGGSRLAESGSGGDGRSGGGGVGLAGKPGGKRAGRSA